MNYQLEAEMHFDDRCDPRRVFIGRMFCLGFSRIERRMWSICIRLRTMRS